MTTHSWGRRGVRVAVALGLTAALIAGAGCDPEPQGPSASTTVPFIPATTIVGTPSFPSPLVAVADDGAVVTVSQAGTRVRALVPAGGPVNSISLSAGKATAYFDRIGADGTVTIYAVPTAGGPAQAVAFGGWPAASRTGDRLAYVTATHVVVRDLATGQQRSWALPGRAGSLTWAGDTKLVWVNDSTAFAVLDTAAAGAQPQVVTGSTVKPGERLYAVVGGPGAQLASAAVGFGYNDTSTGRLDLNADLTVTRTEPTENAGYRDRSAYSGGHWFLRVDALHNLRWSVGGGAGLIAKGYLFADW